MIRKASGKDIEEIMNILEQAVNYMESKKIFQWDDEYPDRKTIEKDIETSRLYKFNSENEIYGIMVMDEQETPEYSEINWTFKGNRIMYIHRLCIHPNHQGKGISKKLMKFAEEFGRENKFDTIRLDAFSMNPAALNLYKTLNYNFAGICKLRKGDFHCFEKDLTLNNE